MRPFLALDTATDHVALAVGDLDARGEVLAATAFRAPRAANTIVLLEAEQLLASVGLAPGELHAVACGRGPGSFTGVRIAVATAKGIAHGAGVPLVGFGTLDAIATRTTTHGLLGVIGDAMRGEVYPALFRAGDGRPRRLTEDAVVFPADVAAEWAALGEPVTVTGGGLVKHRAVFESVMGARLSVADERLWAPDGASLVAAAWAAGGDASLSAIPGMEADGAFVAMHPARLLPVYTRLSDAEEAERAAARRPLAIPDGGVAGPEAGR